MKYIVDTDTLPCDKGDCTSCPFYEVQGLCEIKEKLKSFPQVKHGEWIPCSERLPDKGQKNYLVTIDYGDGLSCVAPRFFFNDEIGWNDAEEYITAWMPLPEPYKREGDDK